ncbi:MAG: 50S ribosomal protein L2 [Candidatus Portnoybacteria bacterium]|nr:50S ribosomal protein L2 [Candidatus Portnoybacteria bacterium]
MRQIRTKQDFSMITRGEPAKRLTASISYKAGRSRGKISTRHKGGRVKRLYRTIDFNGEDMFGVEGSVETIEYDPYRSARIGLVLYANGERRYILAPQGVVPGDKVQTAKEKLPLKPGMRMPLALIPSGTLVHNIQLGPGRSKGLVRSAGSAAQVMALQGKWIQVKLPSSEIRLFPKDSLATVGQISNPEHSNITWQKAGRMRWRGIRPTVRGVAMSPYAHPHGGGEGRTGEGRHPKTPWGKPARGVKTRKKHKWSNRLIVQRRKK